MTKKTMNILAVDLGAESGRAILGRLDGEQLRLEEVHRFSNGGVRLPDGLHWDALRLWSEIKRALSAAGQQSAEPLAGMGMDTWGVDFGLLDNQDGLIGNPFHYRDDRTDGVMEEVFRRVSRAEIFNQTGIQFMQLNTLYQLAAMVLHHSPALEIARTFLTMPDLLNFWLTGRKGCEFTNATTTQCYDPRKGDWAWPILQRVGIPTHIFPEIVPPGTVLGPLSAELAQELGLPRLPVIAPACHDTGSAVAAVPADGRNFAWISSGTWSIMGVETRQAVINAQALADNLTNEGGVENTIRLSKNIMGLWLVQECRRTWARQGETLSYEDLTRMAAEAEALRCVIDPDDSEFLKPGDMPARIREFCARTGQRPPDSKGQVVRCALEGLALKYRWTLERLEALLDTRFEVIHIVGGGTQNRLLSQFAADATGRPVVAGPVEATAIGNLIVQAKALGELASLAEGRELVRRSFMVETFEPVQDAAWDDAYARFLRLLNVKF